MTKTMHEEYGDGSDHQICRDCGFCLDCCDCDRFGCGSPKTNNKNNSQQRSELNQHTAGGHDVRTSCGSEGSGKPSKKSPVDLK